MADRVKFKEFAQVRKNNKTIAWPAGEYDYVPEMDPIIADGRAARVPPSEASVATPVEHVQGPSAPQHVQAAQATAPAPPILRIPKHGKG
jgi:hypothetical protein